MLIVRVNGNLIIKMDNCGVIWLSKFNVRFSVSSRVMSGNVSISLLRKIKFFVLVSVRNVLLFNGSLLIGRVWKVLISSEINYKWLLNVRNSSNVSIFMICVKMGILRWLVGLINVVNDSFICRLIILLVVCIVVKVNCMVKLSVMLIRICCMVSYRVKNEKIGILLVGNDGVMVNVIIIVRFSFICFGMLCLFRIGVVEISVSMCSNG